MTEPWMEVVKADIEARKLAQESRWDRDEFGIPLKPKGEESAQDRLLREAKVRAAAHLQLSAIYRRLQEELGAINLRLQEELGGGEDGDKKARRCFDYFAELPCFDRFATPKPKYKKGQHGGNDELNEWLMEMYDQSGMSPANFAIGFVNERVQHCQFLIRSGITGDDAAAHIANQFWVKAGNDRSIEKRIRRLEKEREGKSGGK
jgi:hypothetical protein